MKYKLLGVIAFIIFTFSDNAQAQNNTSSPYSMFGIGEIESRTYGLNSGMAGTGIGLQLRNFLNNSNPASLAAIDTMTFIFDISTAAKVSNFTYGKKSDNSVNMNLKKIAMGFRVTPKWAMSIGLRPYSNVGYKMQTESQIEGTNEKYLTDFEGTGGLSRLYSSNSYKITNNLSVGVNASLIFGTIEQTENQTQFKVEKASNTRKFYFDFGAQYSNKINNSLFYTLGAVYGYKSDISLSNKLIVTNNQLGEVLSKTNAATQTAIPQYVGTGASLVSLGTSSRLAFAADYKFENWAAISNPAPSVKYVNSHKVSVGMQYLPNFRLPKNYLQVVQYQLGASYNLSNVQIDGEQLKEYALTVGFNFPLSKSYIHFSADFGVRNGKNLINEKFVLFTAGVSLTEVWFFKRFYD